MGSLFFAFSLQLVKMLQISRKSVGFHHGTFGNVIVLVQVVRQGAVIQIPEMGQYFQVDGKKSTLFKNNSLVRALDDDEASVYLGQVTKLAPDAEGQVFEGIDPGRWLFKLSRSLMYLLARLSFGGRKEIRVVHREAYHFWIFAIVRNASNRQLDRERLTTMVKHIVMGEKG
ncbi:hypothetical protein TNCV_4026401 [Trichonephila clavipes]|nr:hypothetical protein TNCV_4026401 [Trichonephila clavipes]